MSREVTNWWVLPLNENTAPRVDGPGGDAPVQVPQVVTPPDVIMQLPLEPGTIEATGVLTIVITQPLDVTPPDRVGILRHPRVPLAMLDALVVSIVADGAKDTPPVLSVLVLHEPAVVVVSPVKAGNDKHGMSDDGKGTDAAFKAALMSCVLPVMVKVAVKQYGGPG